MQFAFFPAFFDAPSNIHFYDQEDDEKLELVLRQHFITNIPWIIVTLIGITVPALVLQLDKFLNLNLSLQVPVFFVLASIIVWYMLLTAYVFENFLYWYFNVYIVTNFNIVDINFYSLLNRDVTTIRLSDIESVSSDIVGIFASLFNFGDVKIETAAKTQGVIFANVPFPDIVSDRIDDLRKGGGNGP
ncbi:hypothetical protein HY025_06140 [Candidatus Daviesbacteria bacterium]|nr:hypothetical protein [Candidatus Daviesbacteria bacterium]